MWNLSDMAKALFSRSIKRARRHPIRRVQLQVEQLESRIALTAQLNFTGPLSNWTVAPAATGNAGTDTANLQNALNNLSFTHSVLYLPAGTYVINNTLNFDHNTGVSVLGAGPGQTTIKWVGAFGGTMVDEEGVSLSRFDRVTFDGNNGLAGTALVNWYSSSAGSHASIGNEYDDDIFRNVGIGLQFGKMIGESSEIAVQRDQFINCQNGVFVNDFNALDESIADSYFSNCGYGVTNIGGAGNFNVDNCVFQSSTTADLGIRPSDPFSFRDNYSSGSKQFLVGGTPGGPSPITIQNNTILDTTTTPISLNCSGPLELIDNVIRNSASYTGVDVSLQDGSNPADVLSVGNTFGVPTSVVLTYQPYQVGRLRAMDNMVVDRSTVNPAGPPQLWLATPPVPSGEQVFTAASFDSTGIQNAINAAVAAVNAGTAVNPVVYLPDGRYNLSTTVIVPANVDIQLVGDGNYNSTILQWTGAAGGTVLDLQGPSRANLQNFYILAGSAANGILVENADQPGSRIYTDQVDAGTYDAPSGVGVLVNGLNNTPVELNNFLDWNDAIGIQVVGGSLPGASQVNVFNGNDESDTYAFAVQNGGQLLVDDTWNEQGDGNQFFNLTGSGNFTMQGSRISFATTSQNGAGEAFNLSSPPLNINGFSGNVSLLGASLDAGVVVQPGTTANVLLGGSIDNTYNSYNPWPNGLYNNSTASSAAQWENESFSQIPNPSQLTDLADQQSGTGATNANNFLRQMLAQTRAAQPEPTPQAPLVAGLTDVGIYRVGVTGASTADINITATSSPTGLSATANNTQVALSWNASSGVTSYNIYRSTSSGVGTTLYQTGVTTTSFTDTSLANGTTYYYQITAVNIVGESVKSSGVSATTAPAAPTGLSATAGNAQLALSWTASSGAASYNIYRSTSSGGEGSTPYQTGVTTTSFTDTGLSNGTTYYYQVNAVNSAGASARSSEVSATPTSSTSTPLTTGVTSFGPLRNNFGGMVGAVIAVGSANLTVTALGRLMASGDAQTHSVELVDASTGQVLSGGSVSVSMSGATVGQFKYASLSSPVTLLAGHTYYLVSQETSGGDPWYNEPTNVTTTSAAAVSGGVWSLNGSTIWSPDTITGVEYVGVDLQYTPASTLAAPTGLTATGGNAQVALNWTASSGATSYNIYRSTGSGGEGGTPYQTGVTGTSFTDTGLSNGTTYYYQVTAVNSAGGSAKSSEVSATTAPAAPTGLSATPGNAQVALNWTASSGATSYNIYRGASSGGETLLKSGVTTTSYTDISVSNGIQYYYEVTAVGSGGESAKSSEVSTTPTAAPIPAAPTGLSATAGNAQVALSWNASSGAASYNVYRSTSSGGETLLKSGVTSTSYTDTSVSNGTPYYYEVTAVGMGGESARSSEVSATTAPTAPTGLSATGGNAQVALSWTASSGATSYNIYRSTGSGGEGGTPYQTGVTGTSFTDTGLSNGTTYYYQVTALNSAGGSAKSSEVSATTAPAAPTGLSATPGNAQVALNWTASSGATSYNIYRGASSGGETLLKSGVTTTSYTDISVSNGTTYYYQLTAVNSAGVSAKSSEASATTAPAAPTGLSATAGNAQVALSWTASSGAASYNVYRSTSSGGETLLKSGVTSTSYTDASVSNGTPYYYEVTAVGSGGESARSSEVSATPTSRTPLTTGVTSFGPLRNNFGGMVGAVIAVGSANLTVTALGRLMASGDAQTHSVELVDASTGQVLSGGLVSVSMSGAAVGQFKYASLSSPVTLLGGHTYYLVSQETSGGDSWYNEPTSVTTTSAASVSGGVWSLNGSANWFPDNMAGVEYVGVDLQYTTANTPPVAPTGLSATGGNAQVALNWTASSGATSYNIYRSTSSGGEGSTPYRTGVTGTSFTDTGLTNGTTYYYQVNAVNSAGASARSSEVSATPTSSTSTPLTTGVTSFGPLRNNFGGMVGAVIAVGSANLTVTALGRLMASGDAQTHSVELVDASTGQVLSGGLVSVSMSGATVGQFKYASLSSPVTLLAGHTYYLVSQETSGGDPWYNEPTNVTTTSAASVAGGVWSINGSNIWNPDTITGVEYVGVDLQYTGTPEFLAGTPLAGPHAPALTQQQLDRVVAEAIPLWAATGLSSAQVSTLQHAQFVITTLPSGLLGETVGNTIYIDSTADGYGWFLGSIMSRQVAPNQVDLLTVVCHELGNVLGLPELHGTQQQPGNVMDDTLAPGVRRLPAGS